MEPTSPLLQPSESDAVEVQEAFYTPIDDAKFPGQRPARSRGGELASRQATPYQNTHAGQAVTVESYGVFGYMIFNRKEIRVHGDDNIFITSEPRNQGPIEALIMYRSSGLPVFGIYDWGRSSAGGPAIGYKWISELNDEFVQRWYRTMHVPSGDDVHVFVFKTFFNLRTNRNEVHLADRDNKWTPIYTSPITGKPGVATQPSGWSSFEYAHKVGTTTQLPDVPHMLGVAGLQLMDGAGRWYVPSGNQTALQEPSLLMNQYRRVFAEPNISFAYANR